jgi:hypothetical protein
VWPALGSRLVERLGELEQELSEAKGKLADSDPRALRLRLRDTRRLVEDRPAHLLSMLAGEPGILRAEIAKRVQKITLTPEGRICIASGTWDLLGSVAATMVPEARIAPGVYITLSYRWRIEWSSTDYNLKRPRPRNAASGQWGTLDELEAGGHAHRACG